MNICLACDQKYLKYTCVVITSILENNRNVFINFYILHPMNMSKEDHTDMIDGINKRYSNFNITFVPMNINLEGLRADSVNLKSEVLIYRLYIPEVFLSLSRMLYLDSDIIVRHDITKFYNIQFASNECMAAVLDIKNRLDDSYANQYVNSGVLLMDLNKLRRLNFTTNALHLIKTRYLRMIDQDAINIVCKGKIKLVDNIYNYIREFDDADDIVVKERDDPNIVHFAGISLPIKISCRTVYCDEWWHYVEIASRFFDAATLFPHRA